MLVIPRKKGRTRSITQRKHPAAVLEHVEKYLNDALRANRLSRAFPAALQKKLHSISFPASYRKGHMLFAEGQPARGVFLVEQGRVKLSAESSDGKSLILHVAGPGEIVGLPAVLSVKRYEVTAETMKPTEVNFIPRKSFLTWVQAHGEVGLRIAEVISETYHAVYQELRYLGLSTSAEARLARFLLAKAASQTPDNGDASANGSMTHQEIAAVIGLSRETVTRLLAEFRRNGLVTVQNAQLQVANTEGLRKLLT